MLLPNQEKLFQDIIMKNAKIVRKDMVGIKDIQNAFKLINSPFPDYDKLTYFFPTENLKYIKEVEPNEKDSAFTITGSGKSILELTRQGYKKIVSVDINPFTKHILKLNIAAVKCLSSKEYNKFLLDYEHHYFLSKDIFSSIIDGFNGDEASINFWDCVLINDKEDLLNYFFKPINSGYSYIKYGLPFVKDYYTLKDNMDKVQIEIHTEDALTYLKRHPEQKFNYLDITNILLYIYQIECENDPKKFMEVLESIKEIYDANLLDEGTFVFHYFFGASINSILDKVNPDLFSAAIDSYRQTFLYLKENYDLESMSVEKIVNLEAICNDTLLYTKKRRIKSS